MAEQTEAACLFDTGALYGRRGLLKGGGDPVFVGFKPGAFSVYFGDSPIYHFDRDGRWQRAFVDGLHYLKGLDGVVQTVDRVREGANLVLRRKTLGPGETRAADGRVRATALDVIDGLATGRFEQAGPPPKGKPITPEELRATLERIAGWDDGAWSAHVARYRAAYGPLPFVPPDSPNPVILQATVGHAEGVAFGGGRAAPHAVRTPGDFDRHAEEVATLLGRRVEQSKALFLGGSDVLTRPLADVAAYLTTARRVFPVAPTGGHRHPDPTGESPHTLDGVHAFLDRFDAVLPDAGGWHRLREWGLTRVCLGVESGAADVRSCYGKRWHDGALRAAVAGLKGAGIGVGLAVLVGAGGEELAARHVAGTTGLVDALRLGRGDLVMLLDAREVAGSPPSAFTPLSQDRHDAQRDDLRAALRVEGGAKVVPYSLGKQGLA